MDSIEEILGINTDSSKDFLELVVKHAENMRKEKLLKDWEILKKLSWHKFPKQQILIDEGEKFMVMRRKSGTIVIASICSYDDDNNMLLFMDRLKEEAENKWNTKDVSCLVEHDLNLELKTIKKFPEEIKYFRLHEAHTPIGEIPYLNRISKSNFEQERYSATHFGSCVNKKEPIDWESVIMWSLENGEGARFGFKSHNIVINCS